MDLAEEAKSLWPISSVFSAPLLLLDRKPLLFYPSPTKLTTIRINDSSAGGCIHSPLPSLSLSRFLQTTNHSLVLPSTASSIAQNSDTPPPPLLDNSLQMLRCSRPGCLLLFFPVGQNLDQVGFVLLCVQGAQVVVEFSGATQGLNHRILRLLVQKVSDIDDDDDDDGDFGLLFISTMYSVFCYAVRLPSFSHTPKLELLATKCFSNAVVHASWSIHLPHECVVLLQTGSLFLFDFEPCCFGLIDNMKPKNLRVSWDCFTDVIGEQGSWLSCEFTWHPRILIVAHSAAVFLADLSSEGCQVECLLRISMLARDSLVQLNDRFVAFAMADGFCYTVACNTFLFVCDIRKPLKPVVQWSHHIDNPSFITVVKLSKLRSNVKNDDDTWTNSEDGRCILMGTFWNCECSLFCYGPDTRTGAASEISKFCRSLYAWGLPSDFSLAARDCFCASCLVQEELSKNALPEWIDWRQMEDIVLGFCILDDDLSVQLFEKENFGGFTLIRLMSSGNLELQRYFASHEAVHKAHKESTVLLKESLIYGTGDEEYNFSTKFPSLKLDHLYGHLNSKLGND